MTDYFQTERHNTGIHRPLQCEKVRGRAPRAPLLLPREGYLFPQNRNSSVQDWSCFYYTILSHLPDSNRGPLLYESTALPAELRWRYCTAHQENIPNETFLRNRKPAPPLRSRNPFPVMPLLRKKSPSDIHEDSGTRRHECHSWEQNADRFHSHNSRKHRTAPNTD